ncbi:MAG TPA: aryldialkylphosphatase [Candidatus Agrococcus pullicola]|uniref:Aryldialkylphosphatase n=1 Tax=Candidatus Agrococcus pullicola TaxID=2838429 RepID=A0A9D1YXL6_9MICO|nr:aryldialkylphosphatase [Candidatus Agrococcus pullicola]
MPRGHARTVLGDVSVPELGRVNAHEHGFQVSPLLPGDELDDEAKSTEEFRLLAESGFESVIDATPVGLGRRPAALARIAMAAGLHIVATTGMHRDAHYGADHPLALLSAEERGELFAADIEEGMPADDTDDDRSDVRAGLAKVGVDYWRISPSEAATIEGIAHAHSRTGVPVMVHLEFCTAAHEVLDRFESLGVPSSRILLAHADRDPDPGLHLDLMDRGAFLGYDGMARPRTRSDAELLDLTERVVASGPNRVLLGGDVARASRYVAYGGMPGLRYLGDRYLPRLRERIGEDAVRTMLVANPAAFLGGPQ